MHKSVATIQSPEFINLQPLDINPLMSSCEIKVLYIGENRNHSYIDKETATEMSKTLRGAPIVGYYKEEKEDFGDHGGQVVIDDEGIKFNCLTRPYGFVAPDAQVWFQKFNDEDDFGNTIEREYLMTTGFLWTGQYPECTVAVKDGGRPHSMELDEETLQGKWAKNSKNGMEFFIINDAIFSKLCILGEDVEPCFEGSSVTAPSVSATFTKMDNEFRNTLYSMMQDLQKLNFALQGGKEMENNTEVAQNEAPVQEVNPETDSTLVSDPVDPTPQNDFACKSEDDDEDKKKKDFVKKDEEEEKKEEGDESKSEEGSKSESEEDDEEKKKKYELLEQQYAELNDKYTQLQGIEEKYNSLMDEYESLVQFKKQVEDAKKDELINSFYMLTDEDKADVIANKSNYSLEDIENKLSVICVRKKVNFSANTEEQNKPITTFNFDDSDESVPAWIKACENTQKNRK